MTRDRDHLSSPPDTYLDEWEDPWPVCSSRLNITALSDFAMSQSTMASPSPPDSSIPRPAPPRRSIFPPSPIDDERLSMTLTQRVLTCGLVAFVGGAGLGGYHGSKMASLRFRAENSHRFPTTTIGWYLYHKSKNYHCMLAAIKEGLKLGPRLAGWAGGFFFIEEAVDHLRGSRDCPSSVIAGLALSGIFSLKSELCEPESSLAMQCLPSLLRWFQYPDDRAHSSCWIVWWLCAWGCSRCAGSCKRSSRGVRRCPTWQTQRVIWCWLATDGAANH